MADKKVDELASVDLLQTGDYVPVFDASEVGVEKLKKMPPNHFKFYHGDPYSASGITICVQGVSTSVANVTGGPKARINVSDFLSSIKGGTPPFTYAISKNGSTWVSNTDPFLAYVEYGCSDITTGIVYIRVTDSLGAIGQCSIYVSVADDAGLCGT